MILDLSNLDNIQSLKYNEIFNYNKLLYFEFLKELYEKSDKSLIFLLSTVTSRDLYSNTLLIEFTDLCFIEYYLDNFNVHQVRINEVKYYSIVENLILNRKNCTKIVLEKKKYQ